ncbi:MAG: NAD-dependent epimerase/dehydratase family protein [Nitrospinota bacterium]
MTEALRFPRVAITGGAGYVGSALVPFLIRRGYEVSLIDLFLYGEDVFDGMERSRSLQMVKGDIRDESLLRRALEGVDCVIHLACISNDPSFELDPALGRSINYDAFLNLLRVARDSGARRLIYASSSSVYGVRSEPDVREGSPCEPLTDYSKYKLACEHALRSGELGDCEFIVLRPATVCGYAPRMRLDLTVNILSINALARNEIVVYGGRQLRPNINIKDMVAVYGLLLEAPADKVHGETFNAGYENHSVAEIAEIVKEVVGDPSVAIRVEPIVDARSYHINSDKIAERLGFRAQWSIEDAVQTICEAYDQGHIPNPLEDPRYYNIKTMQTVGLR